MPVWPGSLPRRPPQGQWEVEIIDPTVRRMPEIGPPMVRKRATIDWGVQKGTFILSSADYRTMFLFWRDDCDGGALTFTGPCWITDDNITLQWGGKPDFSHRGGSQSMYFDAQVAFIRRPVS